MISTERDALRVLLTERGWERVGPPFETWTSERAAGVWIQFCERPPLAGHVLYNDTRSTTDVLTLDHARALLDPRRGVR